MKLFPIFRNGYIKYREFSINASSWTTNEQKRITTLSFLFLYQKPYYHIRLTTPINGIEFSPSIPKGMRFWKNKLGWRFHFFIKILSKPAFGLSIKLNKRLNKELFSIGLTEEYYK